MVETVWVLERAYKLTPREIASAIERILQTDVLVAENEQEVFAAMIALKKGPGSFADAVITALGARRGCTLTLTFDQKALPLPGFEHPGLSRTAFVVHVLQNKLHNDRNEPVFVLVWEKS